MGAMKKKMGMTALLAVVIAGLGACNQGSGSPENTGAVEDKQILGSVFFSPGTFALNGCAVTLPINVTAVTPLNFIAIDLAGAQNLALQIGTIDGLGVVTPLNLTAVPIDGTLLGTIRGSLVPLIPPLTTTPLLSATNFVSTLPTALQTQLSTLVGSVSASIATQTAALQIALTPAINANALVFTGLPILPAFSRFVITANFTAAASAQLASMSMFAATQAQTAAIQSAVFPISIGLCSLPALPVLPTLPGLL
jgi:hypothetical protein